MIKFGLGSSVNLFATFVTVMIVHKSKSTSFALNVSVICSTSSFLWTRNITRFPLSVVNLAISAITTDLPLPGGDWIRTPL